MTTAIYKMTGMSAQRFSLKDRGLIQENYFADIVVFDPKKINETATFQDPKQKRMVLNMCLLMVF